MLLIADIVTGAMPSPGRVSTPAMPHMSEHLDVLAGLVPTIHVLLSVRETWMPRTSPRMTLAHHTEKIAQDAQPHLAALFRVELRPIDVARSQCGRDASAVVIAISQPVAGIRRLGGEGMNEVAARSLGHAIEDGAAPLRCRGRLHQLVPADVGDLVRSAVGAHRGNCTHSSRHHAEACMLAELLADFHQHLHADANAEQRTAAG